MFRTNREAQVSGLLILQPNSVCTVADHHLLEETASGGMVQGEKKELILTSLFENTSMNIIYEIYTIDKIFYCLINWTQTLQCTTKV